ncbi:kelch-like protein 3 [Anopheles moucheti]|uniref:kelch-like protein 3 n=1 Tax=Anopheles moucheti TaxID=186751 RepID=UPI0022F04211|nr:kelch-like protein 3 [Anopheles moucheti]
MAKQVEHIKSEEEAKCGLKYHNDDSSGSRNGRMVNNRLLSDITFIVGSEKQRIYAHKLPLVTASEYFYALFCGSFAEAQLAEIELKDVEAETFLTILRLIYGAEIEINDENIRDIYDHTQMYLLPTSYYQPLINYLKKQVVDKDSAMKIFRENHHYKFELVDEACLPYIQNNPLYYFKLEGFTEIEEERMLKIIGLQQINCTDEQLLCALEMCEFTNDKYGAKELKKLVKGKIRKYFSHKLPLLYSASLTSEDPGNNGFTLQVTSRESIALYGMGVYVKPTEGNALVALYRQADDQKYREISSLNFAKRSNPCLEIVDLMFEEMEMLKDKTYAFFISMENSNGYVIYSGGDDLHPSLVHDNIKISFSFDFSNSHAIAHLWVKCSECGVRSKQASQSCCQY